jgi:hypothetical protein
MSRNANSLDVKETEGLDLEEVDDAHHEPKEKEGRASEDVDLGTTSAALSQHQEAGQDEDDKNQPRDLEALSTVQTNSPPYSVFTKKQKAFIVCLTAWAGFFSPLSANIYFPALTTLTKEYNVSSTLMNLTLTSYMIFQGLAPTIFGDLADMA